MCGTKIRDNDAVDIELYCNNKIHVQTNTESVQCLSINLYSIYNESL